MGIKIYLLICMCGLFSACQAGLSNPLYHELTSKNTSDFSAIHWKLANHFVPMPVSISTFFQPADSRNELYALQDFPFLVYYSPDQGQNWSKSFEPDYREQWRNSQQTQINKFIEVGSDIYLLATSPALVKRGGQSQADWQFVSWPELPGRLTMLREFPGKPGTLLAATDNGLFVSSDQGLNWSNLLSGQSIEDFVVLEATPLKLLCQTDKGFFQSTPAARLWQQVEPQANFHDSSLRSLFSVKHNQSESVYIGNSQALYKSQDQGQIWQLQTSVPENDVLQWHLDPQENIQAVRPNAVFNGKSQQNLVLKFDTQAHIKQILFTPEKWFISNYSEILPELWDGKSLQKLPLTYHQSVPDSLSVSQGQIFSITADRQSADLRFISGWDLKTFKSTYLFSAPLEETRNPGDYDKSFFKVSPANPRLWFVHGKSGLYRSEDAGKSWKLYSAFKAIKGKLNQQISVTMFFTPQAPERIFAMIQSDIHPGNTLTNQQTYEHGRIFFSPDSGQSWNTLLDLNQPEQLGNLGDITLEQSQQPHLYAAIRRFPNKSQLAHNGLYRLNCAPEQNPITPNCWQEYAQTEHELMELSWSAQQQVPMARDDQDRLLRFANQQTQTFLGWSNAPFNEHSNAPSFKFSPELRHYFAPDLSGRLWSQDTQTRLAYSDNLGNSWHNIELKNLPFCCNWDDLKIQQQEEFFILEMQRLPETDRLLYLGLKRVS